MTIRESQIIEKKRHKRDRAVSAVAVICAIVMAVCVIRCDEQKIQDAEIEMQKYDERMEKIENQREESGQNTMLARAERWSKRQDGEGQQEDAAHEGSAAAETSSIYPIFDTMTEDWTEKAYADGFKYYEIPEEYAATGGYFPEKIQAYTFCLCRQEGVRYALIIAMIERESGYRYDRIGDDGKSTGYMQIMEKWHLDRMETLGCSDLMNPYQNIQVGVNIIKELINKYGTIQDALTAYNHGEKGAKENMWNKGIYMNTYNTRIMNRMHEIEEELGLEKND